MKQHVTITMSIDPNEYTHTNDTPAGAIDLITACLRGEADFPETVTIACQGVIHTNVNTREWRGSPKGYTRKALKGAL